jgi:hypothetical protein
MDRSYCECRARSRARIENDAQLIYRQHVAEKLWPDLAASSLVETPRDFVGATKYRGCHASLGREIPSFFMRLRRVLG